MRKKNCIALRKNNFLEMHFHVHWHRINIPAWLYGPTQYWQNSTVIVLPKTAK
jgi:hypothetical protein